MPAAPHSGRDGRSGTPPLRWGADALSGLRRTVCRSCAVWGAAALAALLGVAPATALAETVGQIGQGAPRIGADALWSRGILGQGQTIAVLDEGFMGLDRSIALGELPPRERMTIHSTDPFHDLDGINKLRVPTPHGVRMAEIIHDLAPAAHLVLVRYDTPEQFAAAARWVADQGIPVVSHSNSRLTAPFDGRGVYARAVNDAADRGVLWVNSAGNYAQRHWSGVPAEGGTVIPIAPVGGDTLLLSLSWPTPGEAGRLVLEMLGPDGNWYGMAESSPDGPQTSVLGPRGVESGAYRIVVHPQGGSPQPMELFSQTTGLGEAAVGESSIATPGDAAGALTVAAVHWSTMRREPYSSMGPTEDGRDKPEIAGPVYVTSNPEFPGTAGTSAATPYVAGAAILLRQQRHALGLPIGAADLRATLIAQARPLSDQPGVGAGMVRLDTTRPRLRVRMTGAQRPVLRIAATDDGTIERVTVDRDERRVRSVRRAALGVRLGPVVAPTTVVVRAEDMAGNVGQWRRVLRPRGR